MTDLELAALVRDSLPEELSSEQIALLRRRVRHSAEVRAALADQIQLEQTLCTALGEVHVSLDWIFAQAATASAAGGLAKLFGWKSTTALLMAVTSIGLLVERPWAVRPQEAVEPPVEAVALDRALLPAAEKHLAPGPKLPELEVLQPIVQPGEEPEADSPSDAIFLRQPLPDRAEPAAEPVMAEAVNREQAGRAKSPDRFGPPVVDPALFAELPGAEFERLNARLEALEAVHQPVVDGGQPQPGIVLGGLAKLNEPWAAGTALRILPARGAHLQIHLWQGAQGLSLELYDQPRPGWGAYRATRRARDWRPLTRRLIAADEERFARCGQGTVELRRQNDQLVLVRGDVPLLVVPFAAAPEEIIFEGAGTIRDLSLVACHPLACSAPKRENALDAAKPEQLDWRRELPPGAEWTFLAEGRGELLAEDTSAPAKVCAAIRDPGLREIVFELEDPLPGAGVYLGDAAGAPLVQLGFFSDETTGQTSFGWLLPGEMRTTARTNRGRGPAPLSDLRPWLRLVLAGGAVHCSVSGDGLHWSPVLDPLPLAKAGVASAGLYGLPGGGVRCIRLRRFEARRLAGLEALAAAELRLQASGLDRASDFSGWQQAVRQTLPAGVEFEAWRRSCAVELLAAATRPDLAPAVLLDLLDSALADDRLSPQSRIELLADAALIYDGSSTPAADAFVKRYERLGLALLREAEASPYSAVRLALMTSPLETSQPVNALPASLVRTELALLAESDNAMPLKALCRQLSFFAGQADGATEIAGRQEVLRLIARYESLARPQ